MNTVPVPTRAITLMTRWNRDYLIWKRGVAKGRYAKDPTSRRLQGLVGDSAHYPCEGDADGARRREIEE